MRWLNGRSDGGLTDAFGGSASFAFTGSTVSAVILAQDCLPIGKPLHIKLAT
jgi:hypothetical protein